MLTVTLGQTTCMYICQSDLCEVTELCETIFLAIWHPLYSRHIDGIDNDRCWIGISNNLYRVIAYKLIMNLYMITGKCCICNRLRFLNYMYSNCN